MELLSLYCAMRIVVQRVSEARVRISGKVKGEIGPGLMVLLGVTAEDSEEDVEWLANKTVNLRVFEDEAGRMNRSVQEIEGGILVVSQFTLYGNMKKGTRPSFNRAAVPEIAIPLYELFLARLATLLGKEIPSGEFGAEMAVELVNDGPVTLIVDSRDRAF